MKLINRENILQVIQEFIRDLESSIEILSMQIGHIPDMFISIKNLRGEIILRFNHAEAFHGNMKEWNACLLEITQEISTMKNGKREFQVNIIKLYDKKSGYFITSLNLLSLADFSPRNIVLPLSCYENGLDKDYINDVLKEWHKGKMRFILNGEDCYLYINNSPSYFISDTNWYKKELILYLEDVIFYSGRFSDFFDSPFFCIQNNFIEINNKNFILRCNKVLNIKIC